MSLCLAATLVAPVGAPEHLVTAENLGAGFAACFPESSVGVDR
jgi:hypothetical protein